MMYDWDLKGISVKPRCLSFRNQSAYAEYEHNDNSIHNSWNCNDEFAATCLHRQFWRLELNVNT